MWARRCCLFDDKLAVPRRQPFDGNCNPSVLLVRTSHEVSLGRSLSFHLLRVSDAYLEDIMKKLVIAAAMVAAASTAYAGSMAEPIIEAPVIVEETTSSSSGLLIPLLLLVAIGAAIALG